MTFNDIENEILSDDDYEGIDEEKEEEAFEYFLKKDKNKLKKLIEELEKEYEKKNYIHVLALYEILENKQNIKEFIEKILLLYNKNVTFSDKIGIVLANELKKLYKDKEILEKLNTFIMKCGYTIIIIFSEKIKDILCYVIEAHEWLNKNLSLTKKEKIMLDYVVLKLINCSSINKLPVEKQDKIFRYYTKLLWNNREYIDIKPAFETLFRGINWSYFKQIKKKEDKDIIKYLTDSGIEESVAKEIFELYTNFSIKISIDDEDIPF